MTPLGWFGLIALGVGIVFAGFGAYIANQRGRGEGEGMIFGFLLGPLGLLILLFLPPSKPKTAVDRPGEVYQYRPRKLLGEDEGPRSMRRID